MAPRESCSSATPNTPRRFCETTHLYDSDGFDIDEPLATKMEGQPHDTKPFDLMNLQYRYYDYEFERYWHLFQVFGRIGYTRLPQRFTGNLGSRI